MIMLFAQSVDASFFDERYRGWLWFEEKKLEKKNQPISAKEANREIEELKEAMDERRSIMIARPNAENVRDYIALEELMWERALALDKAYREAKFLYPQYFDKLQDPTNIHAVKFKRKLEEEKIQLKIKKFASEYDLVFFSKSSCSYCKEFAPILKRFSDIYSFKTEELSIDGGMTGLFEGRIMPELAHKLNINIVPTIVAISKNGKQAFEIIRGYVSIEELEEYAALASDYGKTKMKGIND